jgi:hypothetical protein
VQEKSWKQNNTEPEMAKVKKNLHKSIQVWHQRTKGLARQQLDIENYSSLMEKKKQPRTAQICASKFYRFVPYRDSTEIMVFTFFLVADRESTQKRIHKLLLEKETEEEGGGGKCRNTKQTKHKSSSKTSSNRSSQRTSTKKKQQQQ